MAEEQITHVSEDDSPFFVEQDLINGGLSTVRDELNKVSLTMICIDCGEPIGEARKKAVPSATRCIDCETYYQRART